MQIISLLKGILSTLLKAQVYMNRIRISKHPKAVGIIKVCGSREVLELLSEKSAKFTDK